MIEVFLYLCFTMSVCAILSCLQYKRYYLHARDHCPTLTQHETSFTRHNLIESFMIQNEQSFSTLITPYSSSNDIWSPHLHVIASFSLFFFQLGFSHNIWNSLHSTDLNVTIFIYFAKYLLYKISHYTVGSWFFFFMVHCGKQM